MFEKVLATPLPGEVIAGRVPVQEVLEETACAGLPPDAPKVNDVGGEPHAGVVVEVAGGLKADHKGVHAGEGDGGAGEAGGQIDLPRKSHPLIAGI